MIEYRDKKTFAHNLPPAVKLVGFLFVIIASFASTNHIILAALFLLQLCWAIVSKAPVRETLRFSKFFFFVSVLVFAFHWFFGDASLGGAIVLRLWILGLAIPLLLFTTRTSELARSLSRVLPKQLAFVVVLAIRFLPVVMNEFEQIKAAQASRANKSLIPVFSPLFFKAFFRAEALALAAEARAFEASF